MLKFALISVFVLSLATLSFASSLVPAPASASDPHPWIETFE